MKKENDTYMQVGTIDMKVGDNIWAVGPNEQPAVCAVTELTVLDHSPSISLDASQKNAPPLQ